MLDITDRRIVIIGGGAVAARKANGLLAAGASHIVVVSPAFKSSFPSQVDRISKRYDSDDLRDADLVFAATDSSEVNDAVVRDAKKLGIWVNRADGSDESPGDFSTPAQFQSGVITVTVSAGSAALSAAIRDQLQDRFDPKWTAMADAMKMLRPFIKLHSNDPARRGGLLRMLASPQAFDVLYEKGIDGLKDWITTR